jgi:16S rRNA (guanine966-N2)-methyltransferase
MKRNRQDQKKPGMYRIIGGQWRSRRLNFIEVDGLRPTTDRVRETLFNWLAPMIEGARVLDLFAGSGALGFEALSRGADAVTMLEIDRTAMLTLQDNARILNTGAQIIQADALDWVTRQPLADYDLIFADPPFRRGLADQLLERLSQTILHPKALLYLETEREWTGRGLTEHWIVQKEKEAGQVCYRLLRHAGAAA